MVFNDWEINVVYSGEHEVVTTKRVYLSLTNFTMLQSQSII